MKKPVKSDLCHELEKNLEHIDIEKPSLWKSMKTDCLVYVLANIRKVKLRGLKTFSHLCCTFLNMILKVCSSAERIDFIFDSYIDGSVKDTERIRRSKVTAVEINLVQEDTPLPVNMDTFWASIRNKNKLQDLLRKWVLENAQYICPTKEIVMSGTIKNQTQTINNGTQSTYPQLNLPIEEADVRLVPHAVHATNTGAERILIVSSETDVMVLVVHFWTVMQSNGLQEMWMRAGVGNYTRYIPMHTIAVKIPELCAVLLATHILTGCDTTSKVGTKLSALKASPDKYLSEFGKSLSNEDQEDIICKAEQYLVKVIKLSSLFKTMDELRYSM